GNLHSGGAPPHRCRPPRCLCRRTGQSRPAPARCAVAASLRVREAMPEAGVGTPSGRRSSVDHGEGSVLSIRLRLAFDGLGSILVDARAAAATREMTMSDAPMETVFDHFHARRRNDLDAIGAGL